MWNWLKRLHSNQQANALVVSTIFMPVLLGSMAMVVDVGLLMAHQQALETAADAAALAGAALLPVSTSSATSTAIQYAGANGVAVDASQVSILSTFTSNDTVAVQPRRTVNFLLAPVLGLRSGQAASLAQATIGSLAGLYGALPWGVVDPNPDPDAFGFTYGASYTLKLGAGDSVEGNFQALAVDGPGADRYRTAIVNGSINYLEAGTSVNTQTGDLKGPTNQALEDRLAGNHQSFADVVRQNPDGTYSVLDWNSPRLGLVAIIPQLVSPSEPVYVLGFAVFFIESSELRDGTCAVTGIFIDTVVPGDWGPYRGNYGARVVRLLR